MLRKWPEKGKNYLEPAFHPRHASSLLRYADVGMQGCREADPGSHSLDRVEMHISAETINMGMYHKFLFLHLYFQDSLLIAIPFFS